MLSPVTGSIKNSILVEERGQRIGHGGTWQARQIGVVRVQPDRHLTLPVTEDHGSLVVAAAASLLGRWRRAARCGVRSASQRAAEYVAVVECRGLASTWSSRHEMRLPPACSTAADSRSFTSAEVSKVDPSGSPKAVTDPILTHCRDPRHAPGWKHGNVTVAISILALVATVLAVTALANRIRFSAPLLLMLVGIGLSFLPRIPIPELSSELVLIGFLPPLLYAAAIRTSVIDFRANRRSIAQLSGAARRRHCLGRWPDHLAASCP